MNSDIRLSVGFWQHPKTKKTARRLGLEGIRSLQVLWLWSTQYRPDGNLSGMDWEDIELAADWQGEERKFFDTCLGMWVDETPDGYVLHDWQEHNPWQSEALARSEKAQKAAQARWGKANNINEQCLTDAQAMPEHDSSNAPLPFPSPEEEKKEERVFNACARVERPEPEEAPAPEPRKPEAVPSRQPSLAFDEFFEAFPEQHRGGRSEAAGEWVALEANRALPGLPRILDALGQWEDSEAWKRQGGRYIPSAANFLKREYWLRKPPEREIQSAGPSGGRPMTARQAEAKERGDWAKHILAFDEAVRNGDVEDFGFGTEQGICALPATDAGAGRVRAAGQGMGRRIG